MNQSNVEFEVKYSKNVEFKAKCNNLERVRAFLIENDAKYTGTDNQTDVYFSLPYGKLKIRSGNIENSIIYYVRKNHPEPKTSRVSIIENPEPMMIHILMDMPSVKAVVKKKREIYLIQNVRFNLDEVEELGSFIEVEAIDENRKIGKGKLEQQCNHYKKELKINDRDLVAESYSDLLIKKRSK